MANTVTGLPKVFASRLAFLETTIMDPWDMSKVVYDKIVKEVTTDQRWTDQLALSGPGIWAERPDGEQIAYQDITQGYNKQYVTVGYARGFDVTEAMVELDKDEIIQGAAESLRKGAIATTETLVSNLYNNAFSTSFNGSDGVPLCSTGHPLFGVAGGTVANRPSTDADLSVTTLRTAFQQFMQLKAEAGWYIDTSPGTLLVHPNEYFNALEITKSASRPDTADRADNVVPPTKVIADPYLTDTDAWFLVSNDIKGLCLYWRKRMRMLHAFESRRRILQIDADMELDVDFHDWRDVYGTSGG